MRLIGLVIKPETLAIALERGDQGRRHKAEHELLRKVTEADVALTRNEFQSCKCEDHGLHSGMSVDALMRLGSGCTGGDGFRQGWVCPRLVRLRRIYGH